MAEQIIFAEKEQAILLMVIDIFSVINKVDAQILRSEIKSIFPLLLFSSNHLYQRVSSQTEQLIYSLFKERENIARACLKLFD